jgi:glycosyltransferase involved in cell wall biosynthesis
VKPRRLFIADPGLTSALGHHLGYSAAVARAACDEGITPVVLAGRGFEGTVAGGDVAVRQAFSTRYQSAGGGGPLRRLIYGTLSGLPAGTAWRAAQALRFARRRLSGPRVDGFGAELAAALAAERATAEDAVLLHSVSAANLAGLPTALAPRLLVVLRRTPEEMDTDDAAPEPILALLTRLHATPGLRLSLFADTEGLAALFAQGTGLAVHPVPIPVVVKPGARPAPDGLPHVVFAGGARAEKGYAALPEVIEANGRRARFTVQSGPVGAASDPLVQRAHRRLRAMTGAQLTLLETALEPEAYAALLASADLLLLPYDSVAYGPRSSGILAEALALGVPAVVPGGCWMAEAAGPERAMIIWPGQPVAAAVAQALDRLPALRMAAEVGSGPWRARHSPSALLHALLRGFVSPSR